MLTDRTHAASRADVGLDPRPAGDAGDTLARLMKRVVVSIGRQADKTLGTGGLTTAQSAVLLRLRSGTPCNVVELARRCQVDAGALTRLLDRLERKELCRRTRSPADRRVVQVRRTPAGDIAASQARGCLAEVMNAHLAGFTSTEWQDLRSLLHRLCNAGEAMREASTSAGPTA